MPTVSVIGAGTMGAGIAYVFAAAGCQITVVENNPRQVGALRRTLEAQARAGLRRGKLTATAATGLPDLVDVVSDVEQIPMALDLVVETVPERAALKHEVLAAAAAREPAVLATNTSALSIDELASRLPRPEAFLGMHFFNPVWSLHMIELVRGAATAETTIDAGRDFAQLLGKQAIVSRDEPGFATSRLDLVSALEAMRMVGDGIASATDIDTAMTLAYRHPMGPLRLSDVVGLDVRLDIARHLEQAYGTRFAPPRILQDLVAAGHLGRKTGRGFYDWTPTHDETDKP